jgi:hypothetical protein
MKTILRTNPLQTADNSYFRRNPEQSLWVRIMGLKMDQLCYEDN